MLDFMTAQSVLLPEHHELASPWEELFALPVLTLLVSGIVEVEPGVAIDASAVLRIDGDGRGTVAPVPMLTSEADPADGARLGIRLGDDRPWLMVVDADALRVYRRG